MQQSDFGSDEKVTEGPLAKSLTARKLVIVSEFSKGSQPSDLTPREQQVVSLITQGFHNDEIASLMSTDVHTVRRILKAILTKTGLKDPAEIPLYAQRRQL